MRFLSPWRLVLLLAPVALAGAYWLAQRARQRYVTRFTSVDLLASVAPRRPGWQRHVAPAALALALVVMIVGFARPARATRVPRQRGTIVLALDTSASMGSTDVAPSRLAAAEQSARTFVSGLPSGLKVGLVAFDTTARVLVAPTTDRATVLGAVSSLQLGRGTATGDAIDLSLKTIAAQPGVGDTSVPAAIVLMSDGTPTVGRADQSPAETVAEASDAAKRAGVPIDTIAYGTAGGMALVQGQLVPVPSDPAAMAAIAQQTNGRTFTAASGSQLRAVYDQIGHLVGFDTVTHELTALFSGIGILLLIGASAAALWWMQRIT